ncbi:MAG: hypothetical protein ACR2GH_01960 [Pseudonocardia sp.]
MAATITERAHDLWRTWGTRGSAPRALPPEKVRAVYGLWITALILKVLGSTWDVSWHFRWLRDDLAPPHLLNTTGTMLVIALVAFHTWTGYGVDRPALRLMQAGIAIFLVAVPIDVVNHRVNGLDITAWSPSHGLLFLGTAVMLAGVVRGWWQYGTGWRRTPVLVLLWAFALENVWFPAQQQEYGVLAVAAWDRSTPDAEPILLQFAADQLGRPIDRVAVLHFALPTPPWLYPVWLLAAAAFVLVLARWMIGRRWAATATAAAYVAYRCVAWVALVGGDFPPSAVPFLLIPVAMAVDLAFLGPLPDALRPLVGAALVGLAAVGGAALQAERLVLPPIDPVAFGTGTLLLAMLWIGAMLVVRSAPWHRWVREH